MARSPSVDNSGAGACGCYSPRPTLLLYYKPVDKHGSPTGVGPEAVQRPSMPRMAFAHHRLESLPPQSGRYTSSAWKAEIGVMMPYIEEMSPIFAKNRCASVWIPSLSTVS